MSQSIVERRPVSFALGTLGFIIALTVVSQMVLEALFPRLTADGVALVINWIYVTFSIALVAWLGWWTKIRLTARVNRDALVYLLPLFALVVLPVAFGLSLPEVSLVEGAILPDWAVLVTIVFGVALGAGVAEELLYRGVLLRALEPRGRLFAAVLTGVLFGLTHFSRVILGASIEAWILGVVLQLPLAIGLAAVAFRLDSLWPLIAWHVAVDITLTTAATESVTYVLGVLGLSVVIGVMGLWLLWQDRRTARRTDTESVPGGT
jgi:membrane protease YdiL (CAAX protease family)